MKHLFTFLIAIGLGFWEASLAKAEQRENTVHQIEAKLAHIEADALLEKFSELTKRIHQLELERVELEAEAETAEGDETRIELEQHIRRMHVTQERLEHLRLETRKKTHAVTKELAHHTRVQGERRNREGVDLEKPLHHMERQVKEPRAAGSSAVSSSVTSYLVKDTKRGELHYKKANGEAELKVINPDGKVVFDGPVNTKKQKSKVPTKAMKWLEEVNIKVKPSAPN